MSSLKLSILGLFCTLMFASTTSAGLYGFAETNPYTQEEQILKIDVPPQTIPNYREALRDNVDMLTKYAKSKNPDFKILVHEGENLLNKGLWEYHLEGYNNARKMGINADDPSFLSKLKAQTPENLPSVGTSSRNYLQNLDGIVFNNLFCEEKRLNPIAQKSRLRIISLDKCDTQEDFDEAIQESVGQNVLFYGFVANETPFNNTYFPIINENAKNIANLNDAKNILFLQDDSQYADKFSLIEDIRNSNYDIIIISPLFKNKTPYTSEEVNSLKFKKNGTSRLIFATMNISEASDHSYYWKKAWKIGSPSWLRRASFVDNNSVIVEYWQKDWQKIISHYFKGIVDSGYDGAFLTGLNNADYFEKQTPLE